MIEFPEYREKARVGKIEFEVMDLSVAFFDRIDKDETLYNDLEIIRDASTLTEAQIMKLRSRSKQAIVNKILDLTDPDREKEVEENEEAKKL